MELKQLIALLSRPEDLKKVVSGLRQRMDLSEEEQGFLVLYDHYKGDPTRIQHYLKETRESMVGGHGYVKRNYRYLKVAAILLVLLATGLFFNTQNRSVTSTDHQKVKKYALFREPGVPIFMGEDLKIDWAALMYALDKESPKRALEEWKKIQLVAPENDTLIYFGGIVYQEMKLADRAQYFFSKNAKSNSVFADRSAYFLMLLHRSKGEQKEASRWYARIKNTKDMDLKPYVSVDRQTP